MHHAVLLNSSISVPFTALAILLVCHKPHKWPFHEGVCLLLTWSVTVVLRSHPWVNPFWCCLLLLSVFTLLKPYLCYSNSSKFHNPLNTTPQSCLHPTTFQKMTLSHFTDRVNTICLEIPPLLTSGTLCDLPVIHFRFPSLILCAVFDRVCVPFFSVFPWPLGLYIIFLSFYFTPPPPISHSSFNSSHLSISQVQSSNL